MVQAHLEQEYQQRYQERLKKKVTQLKHQRSADDFDETFDFVSTAADEPVQR